MGSLGDFLLLLPKARNKLIKPLPHSYDVLMENANCAVSGGNIC